MTWIHEVTNNKPVWAWVSTEQTTRYSGWSIDSARNNIRQQVYSAIAHKVAGILFWNSRATSHEFWDMSLDIAKELQLYRWILEVKDTYDWNYSYDIHWKTIQYYERYFLFAVNNTSSSQQVSPSLFGTIELGPNDSKVYTVRDGVKLELSSPQNLGFEKELLSSWDGRTKFLNWKKSFTGAALTSAERTTQEKKIGNYSIHLTSTSKYSNSRSIVEQYVKSFPGAKYRLQAWHKYESGNRQHLIIQFYGQSGWISEKKVWAPSDDTNWNLVKIEAEAPAGTEFVKIVITSGYYGQGSSSYWDDVMLRLIGINRNPSIGSVNKQSTFQTDNNEKFTNNLFSNYPNPFNPTTNIKYEIAKDGFVNIVVYNTLGQVVATLVNENKSSGKYSVHFNANNLPSGIYFYKIESGNFTKVNKMLLLR